MQFWALFSEFLLAFTWACLLNLPFGYGYDYLVCLCSDPWPIALNKNQTEFKHLRPASSFWHDWILKLIPSHCVSMLPLGAVDFLLSIPMSIPVHYDVFQFISIFTYLLKFNYKEISIKSSCTIFIFCLNPQQVKQFYANLCTEMENWGANRDMPVPILSHSWSSAILV